MELKWYDVVMKDWGENHLEIDKLQVFSPTVNHVIHNITLKVGYYQTIGKIKGAMENLGVKFVLV